MCKWQIGELRHWASLRKQPTFGDGTTGFPSKWRLRNVGRNSLLMTRHYPDLGSELTVPNSQTTAEKWQQLSVLFLNHCPWYLDPIKAATQQERMEDARRRWQEKQDAKAAKYIEDKKLVSILLSHCPFCSQFFLRKYIVS